MFPMSDVKIKSIEEKNGAINLIQRIAIEFHQINYGDSFDDALVRKHMVRNTVYAPDSFCLSEMSLLKMSIRLENKYAINL